MKKKYIVFGFFAASTFFGFGQNPGNLYPKKKISKSYIQLVYSHYNQNGNHSAVTGGMGTEELQVFGPEIIIFDPEMFTFVRRSDGFQQGYLVSQPEIK